MQKYLFIDTRYFDVRTTCIEVQHESFVIQENRCYLEPCDEKAWMKQLPGALEKILKNNIQGSTVFFIFPETSVLNLILEVNADAFPVEQKIARALYRDYGLMLHKMCYKTLALEQNKHAVILTSKKFLKFIQKTIQRSGLTPMGYFPPLVGFWSYVMQLTEEKPFMTLFIENQLRRFFTCNAGSINFLDFQHIQMETKDLGLDTLKKTQQLVAQTLNLNSDHKSLLLFGDLAPAMAELYQEENAVSCKIIQEIPELSGIKSPLSCIQQTLYAGLCFLGQDSKNPLQAFNFLDVMFRHKSLCKKSCDRYKKVIIVTLIVWLFTGLLASVFYGVHLKNLSQKCKELEIIKNEIKKLKGENKTLKWQNEGRLFLPKLFLQYCEWIQTVPGRFCIDYIAFLKENKHRYCCFKGRVLEEDKQLFETAIKTYFMEKYAKKAKNLEFDTHPNKDFCEFSIRIPVQKHTCIP